MRAEYIVIMKNGKHFNVNSFSLGIHAPTPTTTLTAGKLEENTEYVTHKL
jgi:hypothetical protein